ncbi:MAG: hypothetical protein LUQ69_09385 [Methanoregulaceae archaeon]|nr:hypothetical protein [Methanoregulaceae archaeon]
MMTPLEDNLKSILQKREPSPDFAQKVMARIKNAEAHALVQKMFFASFSRFFGKKAGAIAVLALMVFFLGYVQYSRLRIREDEKAKAQILFALQLASSKLNHAQYLLKTQALRESN